MPRLTVLQGADAGAAFDLTAPNVTIGRHSANGVALRDPRVSRRHAELRLNPTGGHQLFDLQSGNGTEVNGRVVQVIDLRPGDRIAVGDTILVYESEPAATPPDRTRLVVRSSAVGASEIVRTVAADAGSQILSRPDLAGTDWLRQRLATLAVLYEATTASSEILDVDELLGRVMDLVLRTTEADHGCVMLSDPDTGGLTPRAIRSRAGVAPGGEFVVSRTVIEHVLKEAAGVLVADAGTDERFRSGESIARHQIREVICAPMKGRHGMLGVLFLSSAQPPTAEVPFDPSATVATGNRPTATVRFTPDHLTLAVAVAHQAALAVEETHYYQALLQAERLAAVGQTIAALSHHIKNIMQGVRFGSDMVRMGLGGDDRELLTKGWRLVEKNQGRIDDLILDMLSYSKDREPAVEPVDLNALADEVLDVVRGRAAELGVELAWQPGAGLGAVPCDPEGVHRALLNVVSNALDAVEGATSPRVEVATAADDGFALVTVTDNGPGIPAEKLADIFKPFVSSKGSRGTGLGLPVSRKTLREHGGDVDLTSTPGQGCRFTLRLPLTAAPGPATTSLPEGE